MAVTKLNDVGSRAPTVVVVGLLLAATCLLLTATVASASRPLTVSPSSAPSSSKGDGGAQHTAVESPPVGYSIQTVVVGGTAEQEHGGAPGPMLMDVDMLGVINNQGPSPGGDGH